MILIGRNLSPFVRRCATVLNLLGLSYEQKIVATEADGDFIRSYNPLGRVPALVVDPDPDTGAGEEAIVDSHAIVDYLLDVTPNGETLLPASGVDRRRKRYLSALATGAMEKAVASAYEVTMRPREHVYQPYRERLQGQYIAGLRALEEQLEQRSAQDRASVAGAGWFGGEIPCLADVDAVVAYDQGTIVAKQQLGEALLPHLAELSQLANALPEFATTRWQPEGENS